VLASSGDLQTSHLVVLGRLLTLSTGALQVTLDQLDARPQRYNSPPPGADPMKGPAGASPDRL
jgi:hypothetical protein